MKIKVELNFPANLKEKAVICNLCRKFDLLVNILEASFSTDTGWAILVIEGGDHEMKKAFDFLKGQGVEFDDTETIA